jgi:hypothetical protein
MTLPLSTISVLEMSRGKSHADGAMRGLKWGVPIAVGYGLLMLAAFDSCTDCENKSEVAASWMGMCVLSGVFYGAGIGALVGREHWDRFELPQRAATNMRDGQMTIAMRLQF